MLTIAHIMIGDWKRPAFVLDCQRAGFIAWCCVCGEDRACNCPIGWGVVETKALASLEEQYRVQAGLVP